MTKEIDRPLCANCVWGKVVRSVMTTKYTKLDSEDSAPSNDSEPWESDDNQETVIEEPVWITSCYWIPKHLRDKNWRNLWPPEERGNITECSEYEEDSVSE